MAEHPTNSYTPTASASPAPALVPPEPLIVRQNQSCIGCGYNLRGLALIAKCPECDTPVEYSFRGNELWHSDPQWLWKMRWGRDAPVCVGDQ